MSHHFSMGAINKQTLHYEYPKIASKANKYKCPSCDQDVILRKGKIKKSHYAHKKSENPCYYYDRPSESQIHKDAKMLMKMLLDNKTNMTFCRKCCYCDKEDPEHICDISYNDNSKAVIEYRFHYNHSKRSADIALVEDDNIKYIFEICYKNKTKEENRPEPWFEIDAESFIKNINANNNENETEIVCKREYKCACCVFTEGIHRKAKLFEQEEFRKAKLFKQEEFRKAELLEQEQLRKAELFLRMKKKEESNEKEERFYMGKEDERTIYFQREIVLYREREKLRRQVELEREEEYRREREEEYRREREEERIILQKRSDQNNICSICKINYCKCDTPHFVTDKNKRTACTNCKKRKCKCVRITNFFKNTLTH